MSTEGILRARDDAHREPLRQIGQAIGYGNAQSILGELWDEMLTAKCGIGGRGRMGVTVDDALPPIPKSAATRRKQGPNGGYVMVPAYSVAELKAFAHAAIERALREGSLPDRANPEGMSAEGIEPGPEGAP